MTENQLFDAWVSALRSGRYQQDYGFLKTDRGFCCLGVLCEVAGLRSEKGSSYSEWFYSDSSKLLPERFFPGLSRDGLANLESGVKSLIEMNDRDKLSFSEIADFLEKNRETILGKNQQLSFDFDF
jgi:hypothetical protein